MEEIQQRINPHLSPAQVCCCVIAQPTNEIWPVCLKCNYEILDPKIYVCTCSENIPLNHNRFCSQCNRKRIRQDVHTSSIRFFSSITNGLLISPDKRSEE